METPLSLAQFQTLDSSIKKDELYELVDLNILKKIDYQYKILDFNEGDFGQK